jgi:zinc protease
MNPGAKYGERMPIGLMSVVDSFQPQTLRAYYQKWYRPDNQALIIVGDVDVDHIEGKIKELFSGITVPANAAQVVREQVPDNEQPIYIFEKDKEQQMNMILMFMKHDATQPEEKATMDYLFEVYIKSVIAQMLNSRLREMAEDPESPFLLIQGDDDDFLLANTKAAFQMQGVPKEGRDMETLTAMYREARRVAKFGFTATEYERAKADFLSSLEKQYTNRAKITNDQFGNDYTDHYLTNEPIPSIEMLYQIMNQIAPNIPVMAINQVLPQLISDQDKNLVVMEWAREGEGLVYPTEADMSAAIAKARAEELTAYVANVKDAPLMTQLPKAGTIKKEADYKFGAKELTLSNGATVILLPTDYKDDQVVLQAFSKGGKSLYGEADYNNLKVFDQVIGLSGIGNFSSTELSKALAGKECNADATMGLTRQYVTAHSTPKDLETMFQMMYLYFTSVNKDEKQFSNLMTQMEMALKNKGLSPDAVYSDSLTATIYNHNPRFTNMQVDDLKSISYDRILEIHKDRFKNAAQFTFVIVGKFDEATIRPFIE